MRIAQLTYSYLPITGGADAYAEQLRRLLESAGHEVVTYQRYTRSDAFHIRRLPRLPWPLSGWGWRWCCPAITATRTQMSFRTS